MSTNPLVEVRYLRVPESVPAGRLAAWLEVLSEDERQRAARFIAEADRTCYVASHALLRGSLSRRADVPVERWTFRTGAQGKPELAGAQAGLLEVSLSHTGGFAVCAVSDAGRVGVDVESIRRPVPLRILESCFAPAERRALGATAEPDRAGRFFELWTLKEALLKATGRGLTYPLNRLSFEIGGGAPRVQIPEDLPEATGEWRFETWLVDREFRISLALENGRSVCPITLEQASLCPSTPIF